MNQILRQLVRWRDKELSVTFRYDPDTGEISATVARGNVVNALSVPFYKLVKHDVDLMPLLLAPRYAHFFEKAVA